MLPDSVRLRPAKALFDSLIVDCLAGPDGTAVRRLITDPRAELRAYVDLEGVRGALYSTNPQERADSFRWMHQLWRLVTAECWLRAERDPGAAGLPAGLERRDPVGAHPFRLVRFSTLTAWVLPLGCVPGSAAPRVRAGLYR
jgi:hypothetical protein